MKKRSILFVPCMLVLMVGTAWATSPYDLPYAVQWSFIIGDPAAAEGPNTVTQSPDGTVWIAIGGQGEEVWGNPNTAYGGSNQNSYGQITPNGLILQGNDIGDCVPGLVPASWAQGYSPNIRFAPGDGTGTAYFNTIVGYSGAMWSDASPADTPGHNGPMGFSISSLAGTTPVDFNGTDNSTLPIKNAAGLDPTDKFTFDFVSATYYNGSALDVAMGSDGSYIIATGNQGASTAAAPDMFTVGDFSGPYDKSYKPSIGRVGNDGVTLSGPANQPSCGGRSFFLDVSLNESAGKVYAAGYGFNGSGGTMNFFDPDGPGPIASIPLNSATPDNNKGFAVVYDTTSWAVLQAVVWETDKGGDIIADIMATPDGGFVICGITKGTMKVGATNPNPGTNDAYIQKYNAAGTLVWDYQTQTTINDTFGDMSLDEDGNIYVSGNEVNATNDVILLKFKSSDGSLVWKSVIDNAGTNDSVRDNSSIDKTKVYVLSSHNPTTGTWANTISYVPGGTSESLLQKMSPGDYNGDKRVDFTDVQLAGTSANALPGGGAGIDTYDFNGDGKSDYTDIRYMITNVMARKLGDIHPGPTFDNPPDVDNADLGKVVGSFTGAGGSGKTYFDGDMDFDGDVDNADLGLVAGEFTGALAGNKTDNPGIADLIYNPATGNVKVDASEAGGGVVTSFQLENAAGDLRPANYQGPTGGTFGTPVSEDGYEDVTTKVIADSDLTFAGFTGIHDFGNIFPTGMDLDQLEAFLKTAVYTGAKGSGQPMFDLVIPEPATLALLGLGGFGLLARRRRR